MPICGAKTKDRKQCQKRVSEAGQRCYLHARTEPRAILSRILTVCEAITKIAGTAEGIHWAFQHAWPHIEPIWHSGLFCPESFWWDSLALPITIQTLESPAEIHSKLEVVLKQMRGDEKRIEERLGGYSDADRERVAGAYDKVYSEIRKHYPSLANVPKD